MTTKKHIEKKYNCTLRKNKLENGGVIWYADRGEKGLCDGRTIKEIEKKLRQKKSGD